MVQEHVEVVLDEDLVAELGRVLAPLNRRGAPLLAVTADQVVVPRLATVLAAATHRARSGTGVVVVRGLPIAGLSAHQRRLVTWTIGLHLGVPVSQSALGHLLRVAGDGACTAGAGPHTDAADLSAFLAEEPTTLDVTSSEDVVATLAALRPDLAPRLFEPRVGGADDGTRPVPLACLAGDRLALRLPADAAAQDPTLRDLVAAVGEVARGCRTLRLDLAAGDLALVDNYTALHTAPRGRALVLWLALHAGRDLPAGFTWTTAGHRGVPARGGIAPRDLAPA